MTNALSDTRGRRFERDSRPRLSPPRRRPPRRPARAINEVASARRVRARAARNARRQRPRRTRRRLGRRLQLGTTILDQAAADAEQPTPRTSRRREPRPGASPTRRRRRRTGEAGMTFASFGGGSDSSRGARSASLLPALLAAAAAEDPDDGLGGLRPGRRRCSIIRVARGQRRRRRAERFSRRGGPRGLRRPRRAGATPRRRRPRTFRCGATSTGCRRRKPGDVWAMYQQGTGHGSYAMLLAPDARARTTAPRGGGWRTFPRGTARIGAREDDEATAAAASLPGRRGRRQTEGDSEVWGFKGRVLERVGAGRVPRPRVLAPASVSAAAADDR